MSEYFKIHSLWKREGWYFDQDKKNSPDYQKGRQSFIIGDYAEPEFACIKQWRVTEKIDGTNIRIEYEKFFDESLQKEFETLEIKGRTDNAQIPPHLLKYLQMTFTAEKVKSVFQNCNKVTLYGEGYGPKIQGCGSLYADEPGFVLFDIMVGGWVLKYDDLQSNAETLGIPLVPTFGIMTTEEVVDFVKSGPKSVFSKRPQIMEGVVCSTEPVMMYRRGGPIKMKLKCKEFPCTKLAA